LAEERHYVRGHLREPLVRGYTRRKPYTYREPTEAQRQARAILARTAFDRGRDRFGTAEIVDRNGEVKEVPASAVPIAEEMRGMVIKPKAIEAPAAALTPIERLRRALEILATSRLLTE
jgi:hypothetical protein